MGIDRILERASVAKASLYGTFGSKEDLVCAYLTRRSEAASERRSPQRLSRCDSPRVRRSCAVFDLLEARASSSRSFRGCAFLNASVEGPRGADTNPQASPPTHRVMDVRSLFEGARQRRWGLEDPRRGGGAARHSLRRRHRGLAHGSDASRRPLYAQAAWRSSSSTPMSEAANEKPQKSRKPKPTARRPKSKSQIRSHRPKVIFSLKSRRLEPAWLVAVAFVFSQLEVRLMWIVQLALRRPYTFVVMSMLIVVLGVLFAHENADRHAAGGRHPGRRRRVAVRRASSGGDGAADYWLLRASSSRRP